MSWPRDAIIRGSLLTVLIAPLSAVALHGPAAETTGSELLSHERRIETRGEIAAYQSRIQRAGMHWTAGETSLMRLDAEQRRLRRMPGRLPLPLAGQLVPFQHREFSGMRLPERLDWRNRGGSFVTPVRDQGACGASWSYASVAALESAFLLGMEAGRVDDFDLSERQLLECMPNYGFAVSCESGWAGDVFWFAREVGLLEECCLPEGLQLENPCESVYCPDPESRRYRFAESGPVCLDADIEAIRRALLVFGPLISNMRSYPSLDAYRAGLYQPLPGEAEDGMLSVLIIGYDAQNRAWLVKNSWGENWGMNGFALVSWDGGTGLGDWTEWVRFDPVGRGPHASFALSGAAPRAGEPVRFEDRSAAPAGEIVSWEWDFDSDGKIDAVGPGPHEFRYKRSGRYSPLLRVTDAEGREDEERPIDLVEVVYNGPLWVVDASRGSAYGEGSPGDPFLRIQSALNTAAPGDTVLLKPGLYEGVLNCELRLAGELVLRGEGAAAEVVLDGGGESRIMTLWPCEGAGSIIENLTLRGGFHAERGGAVLAEGAPARFINCRFEANRAGEGGLGGGAIWSDAALSLERCEFLSNESEGPGGALHVSASLGLSACRFEGNRSAIDGGALALEAGGRLYAVNTVFLNNLAPRGGALSGRRSQARLVHVSATGNEAGESGGCLHWVGGRMELANSILWGNLAPADPQLHAQGVEIDMGRCLLSSVMGENLLDADPLFADAKAGDLHLQDSSPCQAAGEDLGVASDIEGNPRPWPFGSSPDLGAYEAESRVSAVDEPAPMAFTFEGIYPNPFNPSTTVLFRLEEPAEVKADIYLPTGQWVSTLLAETLGAGSHSLSWTAADELGEPLASGLFLVRIECRYEDGRMESDYRKAILVK